MKLSKRKLLANRANAKKSTGPRSAAGLQAVSHNRTTHGLCGYFRVLPNESQAQFDDLLERFTATEKPVGDVERELVAKMVRHTWLSDRALRCQEACFVVQPRTEEEEAGSCHSVAILKDLALYTRYQAHHDRAYQQAANELLKRRKERDLAARGFESQKRAEAEAERRERQQNQRNELHQYRVANAKLHLERQLKRSGQPELTKTEAASYQPAENSPAETPKTEEESLKTAA